MGRNRLTFRHDGFGNTKTIFAEFSLDNEPIATAAADHNGSDYRFEDVQKLLPTYIPELPIFVNSISVTDPVRELQIKFFQEDKTAFETYKIMLNAGVGRAIQGIRKLNTTPALFLSNQPRLRKTSIENEEHIWFVNNFEGNNSVNYVRITGTYDDNPNLSFTYEIDFVAFLDKIYGFNLLPYLALTRINNGLSLANKTPGDVLQLEVSIWNGPIANQNAERLTEYIEFEVVEPTDDIIRLKFLNSFGVFETVNLRGTYKLSQELDYLSVESEDEFTNEETSYYQKLTLNIGELEQGYLRFLREILISKSVWIFLDNLENRIVPITKTFNYDDSKAAFDTAQLEFRYVFTENNYTL
jgi:hypothetical protein